MAASQNTLTGYSCHDTALSSVHWTLKPDPWDLRPTEMIRNHVTLCMVHFSHVIYFLIHSFCVIKVILLYNSFSFSQAICIFFFLHVIITWLSVFVWFLHNSFIFRFWFLHDSFLSKHFKLFLYFQIRFFPCYFYSTHLFSHMILGWNELIFTSDSPMWFFYHSCYLYPNYIIQVSFSWDSFLFQWFLDV